MGDPARGYSWPQFKAGNEAATKHGARSERRWRPVAEEIEAELLEHAPWTARPAFAGVRVRKARAAAISGLLWRDISEHGVLDADGNERPAAKALPRWMSIEANADARLGLDPRGFADLVAAFRDAPGADQDILERLRAEGRAIMLARSPEVLSAAPGEQDRPEMGGGG